MSDDPVGKSDDSVAPDSDDSTLDDSTADDPTVDDPTGNDSTIDDGYVHRPSGEPPSPGGHEFDWRGWALVATIVFAFLVVPGALLLLPTVQNSVESLGLTLRDAYLVLPLLPAFLLGAVAVWSAIRSRSDSS